MFAEPIAATDDDLTADDPIAPSRTTIPWLMFGRFLIGIGGLASLGVEYHTANHDADNASKVGASAIQIVQVWTPHLFNAMLIIGVTLTLYVLSRAFD